MSDLLQSVAVNERHSCQNLPPVEWNDISFGERSVLVAASDAKVWVQLEARHADG